MNAAQMIIRLCFVWSCIALPTMAADVKPPLGMLTEMPTKVAAKIEDAILNYPSKGRDPKNLRQANARKNALDSLEKLRKLPWPDYSKLKLVKIEDTEIKCPSPQIVVAWIGPVTGDTISLLTTENEMVSLPAKPYRIAPFPFERFWNSERLHLRLKEVDRDSEFLGWATSGLRGGITTRGQPGALSIFHFAYLAVLFEKLDDLTSLLDRELDAGPWGNEGPLIHAWGELHRHRQRNQHALLRTDAPFGEFLAYWKETDRLFDSTELRPLIARLEQQIAEDRELKDLVADAIAKLTPTEQAQYWISRLPQDKEGRNYPFIVSNHTTQRAVNGLDLLGWTAVPQLIVALRDTRLTRTLYSDSWDSPAQILRVQDLAWAILYGLIDEPPLFGKSGMPLTARSPQQQEDAIANIETWWKKNGLESERAWWLSRLEAQNYRTRMRALTTLEKLDPSAINSVAQLLKWLESAEMNQLVLYCDPLRQRGYGDPIPRLEQWLDQLRQNGYQHFPSSVWLRHGELRDFRFLQQCARMKTPTQITEDVRTQAWGSLAWGLMGEMFAGRQDNPRLSPLAIPLLVDILDRDRLVGLPGRQSVNFIEELRYSEYALMALQKLTGHDVGWTGKGELADQKGAMDRWLAWWRETGRADYLRQHPEVAPMFEDAWRKGADVAVDKLPEMVEAEDPREFCRITYRVPRASVAKLVTDGSLLVNTVPQFADRFRFVTPAAAEKWFRSESTASSRPLPCMIVPIADSMESDSQGRIWCRWDLFGFPPAVFDKGHWTTFADQRLPESWPSLTSPGNTGEVTIRELLEQPRAGSGNAMLFPNTVSVECKHELQFDLQDVQGWLHFSVSELPMQSSFDRVLKAAPPPRTNRFEHYQFVRDEVGRIFTTLGDWKIIEKGREIPKSADLRNLRASSYISHGVIGNGDVWLVSRHNHEPMPWGKDEVVALAVEQGEVVEKPLPLAPKVGPPRAWVNQGWVESSDPARRRGRSATAWDANGNVVAQHEGHLVGIDSQGGHWLLLGPRGAVESLQRVNAAGQKHSWKNPNFKGPDTWSEELSELAFAPDGTVWAPVGSELIHLGYDDEAVKEIEQFPLPEPRWNRVRCDPSGDVWIVCQNHQDNDKRLRLYRFATHAKF